jgi:hypothetical protein
VVERRKARQRGLTNRDVRNVIRVHACLDDQLVADRQELQDHGARRHDTARGMEVSLDDHALHGSTHLDTLDNIPRRAGLLQHVIELRLSLAQLLHRFLDGSRM